MGYLTACTTFKCEYYFAHFLPISSFPPILAAGTIPKMATGGSSDQETLVALSTIPIFLCGETWRDSFWASFEFSSN